MKGQGLQSRIHYKGKEDFVIFVSKPEDYQKFKKDSSTPLSEVLESYDIFTTGGHGAQGKLDQASKGQLENEFGTTDENEVLKQILEKGTLVETMAKDKQGSKNESHGSRNAF